MALYAGIELPGKPDLENIRRLDALVLPQLNRMTRYGIAVDLERLRELSSRLALEMDELRKDIASYIPAHALDRFVADSSTAEEEGDSAFNPNSAEQIRDLLFDLLKIGEGSDLQRTKSGKVSTGKKQLELNRLSHPVVAKVLDYRERSKLKSAFADALPLKAKLHPRSLYCPVCELPHSADTYRVHSEFKTTRADTGRLASASPNLQQIPTRTELGGHIRRAFVASPGTKLVSVDFSQCELRDLAHLADAASMIQVYSEDKDIHLFTACQVFDLDYGYYADLSRKKEAGSLSPVEKPIWSKFALECRLPSKNLNFMTVYGATWKGLQAQLALSGLIWDRAECESFIAKWFNLYSEVEAYIAQQTYRVRRYGYNWGPFGRIRLAPWIRSCHPYVQAEGERAAGNHPIQNCNAEQTKLAQIELEDALLALSESRIWAWPLLPVHDQIICEVEEDYADMALDVTKAIFEDVMRDKDTGEYLWRVAIKADGEVMDAWKKD